MASKFLISVVLLSVLLGKVYSQTTMFNVDPQHSGVYSSKFASSMIFKKKWSFKTNGKIFSSGVVLNHIVYFGSDDSCLYAIDTIGNLKWKFKSNGKVCSTPAVKDTVAYFNNYSGMFYAVNTKTGKEIWNYQTDGEKQFDDWDFYLSSPTIVDTMVYFGSGKNMYGLNIVNKKLIWKYTASQLIHSTPCLKNDSIYFGCWNGQLIALNAKTGIKLWSYACNDGIPSSPSIVDSIILIGSRDAHVYAINAKNGTKIWSASFGASWMPSSFAIVKNIVYTGSSDALKFYALNLKDGKILGSISTNLFNFSTPAIAGETGFIGSMNGSMYAIDLNTYKIKCKFDTEGRIKNPLKAITPDGHLSDSVKKLSLWLPPILTAGSILSTPVIDKNTVYFGSSDSIFYAICNDSTAVMPNIEASASKIDLGTFDKNKLEIDTFITVTNNGQQTDSFYTKCSSKNMTINPSKFILNVGESKNIVVKINTATLNIKGNYTITASFIPYRNEYLNTTTDFSFKFFQPVVNIVNINNEEKFQLNISPNPFSAYSNIKYTLEQRSLVNLQIYNSMGQIIKTIISNNWQIGEYNFTWDGTNDQGSKMNSGIYICSLQCGDKLITKMIVLRN
jgi:eukaryotic-like serine/threonine-protein kinase